MGFLKVSEPMVGHLEKKYLCQAIDSGEVSGSGRFVQRFEEAFSEWSGNDYAVAVSSGTAALETAIWSLGLREISIPSGTIISCYIAAIRAGASVTLRDNNTPGHFRNNMRCHLFGHFDNSTGFYHVDDCSQYWVPFRVKDVGCYSLYANKLITSGEGGVLVTNSAKVYERARQYRDLCHGAKRFVHEDVGYNFRMSNLQAAVALAQLEQINKFVGIKRKNRDLYLRSLPDKIEPLFNVAVPWMYLVRSEIDAMAVEAFMLKNRIECRRFFYPLHKQKCLPRVHGDFHVAEDLREYALYLPSGLNLTRKEIEYVCKTLRALLRGNKSLQTL